MITKGPSQEMREITVGPALLRPFETGAMLYALQAFPGRGEVQAMHDAAIAICADYLQLARVVRPEDAEFISENCSQYLEIDVKERRRRLRTLERRLSNRAVAARMSMGFFKEGLTKKRIEWPIGVPRHSINALSEFVKSESGESDSENVERRIWRPSLPVVHLAAAFTWTARASEGSGDPYTAQLDNDRHHKTVVEEALRLEEIVLSDRRFGIKNEDVVRVSWAG